MKGAVVTGRGLLSGAGVMGKIFYQVIVIACFLGIFPGAGVAAGPPADVPGDDAEASFDQQVVILKKIKVEFSRTRKIQHFRQAEDIYQLAQSFVHQQRWGDALALFNSIQEEVPGYKDTDRYIKVIEYQMVRAKKRQQELSQQRLLLKCKIIKEVRAFRVLSDVTRQYARLYQQGRPAQEDPQMAGLGKNMERVYRGLVQEKKDKQSRIKELYLEFYVFRNLSRVMNKAEGFDREVFGLVGRQGLDAANQKIREFQKDMLNDLTDLKGILERKKANFIRTEGTIRGRDL